MRYGFLTQLSKKQFVLSRIFINLNFNKLGALFNNLFTLKKC